MRSNHALAIHLSTPRPLPIMVMLWLSISCYPPPQRIDPGHGSNGPCAFGVEVHFPIQVRPPHQPSHPSPGGFLPPSACS